MPVTINGDGIVTAEGTSTTQGRLRLGEDTDNGTNYVELQAPASVASNVTFTLPSADGTNGQVLQTNGSGALSFATPAGASLSEFTSSGTWTKPSGATFVMVECWGAGGGGGSGRRGAASSDRVGGGGGGGGAYTQRLFKASDLGATETVTIGAGGTAGAARTTNDTSGQDGGNGGDTTFGTALTSYGGGGGQGGQNTNIYGGTGGGVLGLGLPQSGVSSSVATGVFGQFGGGSGNLNINNDLPNASGWGGGSGGAQRPSLDVLAKDGGCSFQGGPGGGAGALIRSVNTAFSAGVGGSIAGSSGGGGAAGASAATATSAGGNGTAGTGRQGGGGGGNGGTTSGVGGTGGAGGQPGGGGGGGGASTNGSNSGAGGAGGAGLCRVYTW